MKVIAEVKEIITDSTLLGRRCKEIDVKRDAPTLRKIVADIKKTMRNDDSIVALSAPQIGYDRRIFCIRFDEEIKTFVNPIISNAKGLELSKETCRSIPGKTFIRPRNNDLNVYYMMPDGKPQSRQMVGLAAIIFQHHIDHLDGLLLEDVGLEIDDDWDELTDEEKQEIISEYLDALDLRAKEINTELKNDQEAKDIKEASEFLTSVATGKTQLEYEECTEEEVGRINQAKREVLAELQAEGIEV